MAGFEPQTNILIHMVGSGLHQEPDVAYAGLGPGADTIPRLESAEPSDVLSDITPTVGYGWHPIVRNLYLIASCTI
ncbi:unnamed protein product [Parascedosporium putredinis]|uniref:Uncharacterized protein n=1 Tax=Parascedosporium putredinis TaxID=1442378 RepID=A0A9P1H6M9_9PEZI|nr:unnamed protein product [Parascedosporium putredinis]CAI7998962.1 unnamed protein product [Parascedosporium putredinis]